MMDTVIKIRISDEQLKQGLETFKVKVDQACAMFMRTKASELQAYMQVNRPWTDRTGMAKATLRGEASKPEENLYRITLAHGVDYGIWLELANSKNYAIIGPTIDIQSPIIFNQLQGLFDRL